LVVVVVVVVVVDRVSDVNVDAFRRSADAGSPSPEVSMILEKYSDMLLGMVQQKLLVSQSTPQAAPSADARSKAAFQSVER
jgi:hypothetical protein